MFELREPEASPPAPQMFGNAGPRAHGALRVAGRPLRVDRLEEPQALGQQPLRAVPGRVLDRGHQGGEDDPRAADQAPVLADLRRRRARRSSPPSASSTSTACGTRRSRSPARRWSPTWRARSTSSSCIKIVGYDMSKEAARQAMRGGAGRDRRRPGHRAARLLQRQRAHHVRSARPRRGGSRPRARGQRGHDLRRPLGRQPVGRADLQGPSSGRDRAGAVRRADVAAARRGRTSVRSRAPRWASSTTSASAARPWSASIARRAERQVRGVAGSRPGRTRRSRTWVRRRCRSGRRRSDGSRPAGRARRPSRRAAAA